MNILFLDSIEKTVYGGMEEWIRLVAFGLSERGHTVLVAGRPGSEFIRRVRLQHAKIKTIEVGLSGDFNPIAIASLKKHINENGVDLLCVNFNRDVRLGGIAARLNGDTRVVWSVGLDITSDSFMHRHLTPRLVDGIIVPSESLKRQITRHDYISADQVQVIPIGIGPVKDGVSREQSRSRLCAEFGFQSDNVICVTVGRFVEQKGHCHLIDAAKRIVNEQLNVRFLFFGSGPLEAALRKQVEEHSLSNYVVFAGMRDNVSDYLPGCDLMIHPSVEEPFGIALLEGMRAGLPIVASRVGGIPEVVRESINALLVAPGRPESLSDAVIALIADEQRLQTFGRVGHERWREEFQLDSMVARVESYFVQISRSERING